MIVTLLLKQILGLLWRSIRYCGNFRQNVKMSLFNFIMWLPCGRKYINKEKEKNGADFTRRVRSKRKN